MTPPYGLIVRDGCQVDPAVLDAPEKELATAHGPVRVKLTEKWAVVFRSGLGERYLMPHEYNSAGNMAAFKMLGLSEVVGVHSTGSLRPSLAPGTLVVPDDWINFTSPPVTIISGQRRHLTPSFSHLVRQKLADAAWKGQVRFENGGVYWQSPGPRLETKAEVRVMSNFADLVGMGLAAEANLAQEMGLEYGAVCSVDNYANGLGVPGLTDEQIRRQSAQSMSLVGKVLDHY